MTADRLVNPVESYVDDITLCPVCKEDFSDPRSLPCVHTFCLKCLKRYCYGRGPREQVRCPLCRKEFDIPDAGVEAIPRNFYMQGLVTARNEAATKRQKQDIIDKPGVLSTGDTASDARSVQAATESSSVEQHVVETEPTEPTFQTKLRDNFDLISRCLVLSSGLLFRLKSDHYMRLKLTHRQATAAADLTVGELLNIIDDVPDSEHQQSTYNTLLSALRHDGQEHVANIFYPESDARPMSDEHHQLLLDKNEELRRTVNPSFDLLDIMVRGGALSQSEKKSVMTRSDYAVMSQELINILLRKPDGAFDTFVDALKATDRLRAVYILTGEGDANKFRPMSDEHYQLLVSKRRKLLDFIDPSCVLLCELVDVGVLSQADMDCVRRKIGIGYSEMSIELVNILLCKPDTAFTKFIEALNKTGQQHVVHILTGQGESPLSRVRRLVLKKAREKLVSGLDTLNTSLLPKLISNDVLTDADKQFVEARHINELRVGALIDIIARKSEMAYDKFIAALKDSGIRHREVAEMLEGFELRGRIDQNFLTGTTPADSSKIVKLTISSMQALVSGTGSDIVTIVSLMQQSGFAVSEVSEGSIHISFRCFTEESLMNLKRLYTDETLDKLFTQVFCPPFAQQGLKSLKLRINDREFERCEKRFKRISRWQQTDPLLEQSNWATQLKQLVYTRKQRQIRETKTSVQERRKLKQLVYSRQRRELSSYEAREIYRHAHIKEEVYNRMKIEPTKAKEPSHSITKTSQQLDVRKQRVYSRETTEQRTAVPTQPRSLGLSLLLHRQHSITTMHSLPYELLEMLLIRSSCQLAKTLLKTDARPDIEVHNTLSSVCRHFNFIIRVKRRRSVRTLTKQLLTAECQPYRLRPQFLTMFVTDNQYKEELLSLCTLKNKLYVAYKKSTVITVYSTSHEPYTLLRYIDTGLGNLGDIDSCRINSCVYVVGGSRARIGRVDRIISNNLTKADEVVEWLPNVGNPQKVSVTSDGRVVVLVISTQRDREEDPLCTLYHIEVYNYIGLKIAVISLSDDVVNPWRAVQRANKTFIVSHGDSSDDLHRVCEVNNTGFIVASYGILHGTGPGQLNVPTHILLDNEERVLVVDGGNRRVLLLDRQLKMQRVLLFWSDFVSPRKISISYEMDERRLFVGFNTGEVEIYSV